MKNQKEKIVRVKLSDIEIDLTVGTLVFEVKTTNSKGHVPKVYEVINIGNKYFTVGIEGQPYTYNKYEIKTGKHYDKVYGPQYALYSSPEAYQHKRELRNKEDHIRKSFTWDKLNDSQIERIYDILKEVPE